MGTLEEVTKECGFKPRKASSGKVYLKKDQELLRVPLPFIRASSPVFCERRVSTAKNISNALKNVDPLWRKMLHRRDTLPLDTPLDTALGFDGITYRNEQV
jgi:hypothetical protein